MKLLVIGHARHGKDTVCGILSDTYGLRFVSSSLFCLQKCVRADLERQGICYASDEDCYNDRHNHRPAWYASISLYNADDHARLGRELLSEFDIYCGLRSYRELIALADAKAFDCILWVDRSHLEAEEPTTSFTIPRYAADYVINNNHDMDHLREEVRRAYNFAKMYDGSVVKK